jgi:uncharacterized protein YggL (DUF469 family)
MFKKLLDDVRNFFGTEKRTDERGYEQALRKKLIIDEYKVLHEELKHATTLGQLLELRKTIREFQQDIIENQNYVWGKIYIEDLNNLWKQRYTQWKKK